MKVRSNQVFRWNAGLCLKAVEQVSVSIPGNLVLSGEPLREVIELSDENTEMAFHEHPDPTKGLSRITIRLKIGDSLRINKSTEVFVQGGKNMEVDFEVCD